jgi:hypothetical protein
MVSKVGCTTVSYPDHVPYWLKKIQKCTHAPKIVKLLYIEGTMAKISISTGKKSEEKAWIALDERVWGAEKDEQLELED